MLPEADRHTADYYGNSYFVSPRGQIIGDTASSTADAVLVRDLDLNQIDEIRRQWPFYRDRRPDTRSERSHWKVKSGLANFIETTPARLVTNPWQPSVSWLDE